MRANGCALHLLTYCVLTCRGKESLQTAWPLVACQVSHPSLPMSYSSAYSALHLHKRIHDADNKHVSIFALCAAVNDTPVQEMVTYVIPMHQKVFKAATGAMPQYMMSCGSSMLPEWMLACCLQLVLAVLWCELCCLHCLQGCSQH